MNDTSKKYLMKRRRYGYGWIPVTWQGWLLIVLQLAIILVAATFLPTKPVQPSTSELIRFLVLVGCAIASLLIMSSFAGPRPKWRWGKKPTDNPDEDF